MLEIVILELLKNEREGKEIVLIIFLILLAKVIENFKKNERNNKGDNEQ